MPPVRRLKQDVTAKIGQTSGVASYPAPRQVQGIPWQREEDVPMISEAAANRARAQGQLRGVSIGAFMSAEPDAVHQPLVSKHSRSPPLDTVKPTAPPTRTAAKEMSSGSFATGGGQDVMPSLIELVYRNNAESQRSYLEFSPY